MNEVNGGLFRERNGVNYAVVARPLCKLMVVSRLWSFESKWRGLGRRCETFVEIEESRTVGVLWYQPPDILHMCTASAGYEYLKYYYLNILFAFVIEISTAKVLYFKNENFTC